MIEITYSLGLLAAAVIFQAIVHYTLKRGKLRQEEQRSSLVVEQPTTTALVLEESSLDGDEPPVFFELLDQTGCEMMNVRDTHSSSGKSSLFFCFYFSNTCY